MRLPPRHRRSTALFFVLALAPSAAARQRDAVVEKVIELGRSDSRVDEHLRYLVERIGPRLTGSPGLQRANEWARARFAAFGLEARLERWGEMPVGFERGPSTGGMVAPLRVDYVFGTQAWSPGTPGPVRALALLQPRTVSELEADPGRWFGTWVVDLPREERPRGSERRKLDAALAELGIAGRVRNSGELVHTGGNSEISFDELPTQVSVQVQRSYFDDLLARLQNGQAVELEFDVDNRFLPGPFPQYNVVADLVGSEFPDQYVVVGGHIDSWDGARGAQDNGTGVATTLEAARLLAAAGAAPRRTIRFMLWSGEEQGLLGSRAYVAAHQDDMERVSAVLVHDGGTNYLSGIAGPPALVGDLRFAFEPVLQLDPLLPFEVEENGGLSRGGGSDHSAFVSAGVPGFFWEQSGRTDYDFVHHTQHDHLEHVVPEYQRHSAMVVAIGAYNLACLDHLLDRTGLIDPSARGGRDPKRRLIGVYLEDNEVTQVLEDGMAAAAAWQEGDVIVSIDGVEVADQREIGEQLQSGGPRKVFVLRRGEELVESVLDYTGTESEKAREAELAERRAAEAAEDAQPAEAGAAKEPELAGTTGG